MWGYWEHEAAGHTCIKEPKVVDAGSELDMETAVAPGPPQNKANIA